MNKLILLLGGNQHDTLQIIAKARGLIKKTIGKITDQSSIYQSEPWGFISEHSFLNQVIVVNTMLVPEKILQITQGIEQQLGRGKKSTVRYQDRPIDIDLLFYNSLVISKTNLSIPHPKIPHRRFTLLPLNQVSPDLKHPVLKSKVSELLAACVDQSSVSLYIEKEFLSGNGV